MHLTTIFYYVKSQLASNKMCYRQWFDRFIISKMILKSRSNWLFPVDFSVEITLSGSHSRNSFEFSHPLTSFLNYALFCLSFCLCLNLKPVIYLTTRRSSMEKCQGSILSFFGNANGHTQQKTTDLLYLAITILVYQYCWQYWYKKSFQYSNFFTKKNTILV